MNEELTTEQKENLKTWSEQRDSILSDISVLKTENEKLQKINNDLSNSNTEIETRMNEIRGRIEELKIKESEIPLVILKEVAHLQSKKTTLESEIDSLTKIVGILLSQKTSLENDVSLALSTFNTVKDETLLLDKVVDRVTTVSQNNSNRIDSLVNNLESSLKEIIEVNKKNVFETNIVIDKVPKMIMELQKHGLIKNKI
jgi:predicted  nucleic acid-binding Zn-ribbon protein